MELFPYGIFLNTFFAILIVTSKVCKIVTNAIRKHLSILSGLEYKSKWLYTNWYFLLHNIL